MGTTWFKIVFSQDEVAALKHTDVMIAFAGAYRRAGKPRGFLVCSRPYEPIETTTYFFSPKVEQFCPRLLITHGADRCSPPDRNGLSVIVGVSGALDEVLPI